MQVLRCFCPLGSLSRIPSSRALVGDPLLTLWRKPRYCKYSLPCTPRYRRRFWIIATPLSLCLSAPSLWYFASARTCEKRHRSLIILAVWVYRLGYPPGVKLEKNLKISSPASDCIWFWYICYSTKLSHQEYNF